MEDDYQQLESEFTFGQIPVTQEHTQSTNVSNIPHHGSLCRNHITPSTASASTAAADASGTTTEHSPVPIPASYFMYTISIAIPEQPVNQEQREVCRRPKTFFDLQFESLHYQFMSNVFSILDMESLGVVDKHVVQEFVHLRCPVFRRRDALILKFEYERNTNGRSSDPEGGDDQEGFGFPNHDERGLSRGQQYHVDTLEDSNPTFDEMWKNVVRCSMTYNRDGTQGFKPTITLEECTKIGLEGWMVLCRFIALAQYQEAKRRFSVRHSQQTMRHKCDASASELVLVQVPPLEKPEPLSVQELIDYEYLAKESGGISLPELDLDHSCVSAHDGGNPPLRSKGRAIQIRIFGAVGSSSNSDTVEFAVRYSPSGKSDGSETEKMADSVVVRRSFSDLEWLHDTFTSHTQLGGTLCGRILPPFPSRLGSRRSDYNDDPYSQSSISSTTAKAVASAGVSAISTAARSAKSLFKGYLSSNVSSKHPSQDSSQQPSTLIGSSGRKSYSNSDSAEIYLSKAQQLERYLNYLLEHPALSTSFPLNVVLKASQSGLESAKQILLNEAKYNSSSQKIDSAADEGKSLFYTYFPNLSIQSTNLSWVRTAAQAALALKLDGVLETSGCLSTSAKLQQASLPNFTSRQHSDFDHDDGEQKSNVRPTSNPHNELQDDDSDCEFEKGVVSVKSTLDGEDSQSFNDSGGYDLLPNPLPLSERSALCAGNIGPQERNPSSIISPASSTTPFKGDRLGSHYGINYNDNDFDVAMLGDLSVDKDIDRLRDIIRTVDESYGRCLSAIVTIGKSRSKRAEIHMNIIKGIDSWEGLRGKIITQRALLAGVSTLEMGYRIADKSAISVSSDMSWNASLASSAVLAAEEVRKNVKAFRIASKAKLAAETAAKNAQDVYNSQAFSTPEEAEAAQGRVSTTQSDAIHAAVIEHEALSAKRKAAVALARDVRYWNTHRKREILSTCIGAAKSQQRAANETAKAWTQLKDGLLDLSAIPLLVRNESHEEPIETECRQNKAIESRNVIEDSPLIIPSEPCTLSNDEFAIRTEQNTERAEQQIRVPMHSKDLNIFSDALDSDVGFGEHNMGLPDSTLLEELSSHSYLDTSQSLFKEIEKEVLVGGDSHCTIEKNTNVYDEGTEAKSLNECNSLSGASNKDNDWSEDFDALLSEADDDEASPQQALIQDISSRSLIEGNKQTLSTDQASHSSSFHDAIEDGPGQNLPEEGVSLKRAQELSREDNLEAFGSLLVHKEKAEMEIPSEETKSSEVDTRTGRAQDGEHDPERISNDEENNPKSIDKDNQNKGTAQVVSSSETKKESMTDSMQSLVDGLMTWGGQWDSDDDISLPFGMAASLAIEEKKRQDSKRPSLKSD